MIKDLKIQKGIQIVKNNYLGRLAYMANNAPHIVPITYFYDEDSNSVISYSAEGHKIDSMRQHAPASIQVDEIDSLIQWRSVLIQGTYEELGGSTAKFVLHKFAEGVKEVIQRTEDKKLHYIREFSSKLESEKPPVVFRINITGIISKYRDS